MRVRFSIPRETAIAVRGSLRVLTPRQRHIIEAYYWDGDSDKDIASTLGISHQAVYYSRRAAEKKLSGILA